MSGGKPDYMKDQEKEKWGTFDLFRTGAPANWDYYGGSKESYEALTPEQRAAFMQAMDDKDPNDPGGAKSSSGKYDDAKHKDFLRNWVAAHGGGGSPTAATTAASPDAVQASDYMQAATPGSHTPFGDSNWTQDPKTGQWTQNQTLSGPLSGANDSLQAQWAEMLKKPVADGNAARDQAIDSAYKQSTSRLDPQWDRRMEAQRTQLLNQGLDPTSEAGKNAMQDANFARNDAYSSAMNGAISQGTAAGNSVFQNNLAAYNNPLQQMLGMKTLAQSPQSNSLLNALIAQKNGELGKASLLQQQQTDTMGAAMGLTKDALGYLQNL